MNFKILSASLGKLPVYSSLFHQGISLLSIINLNHGVISSPLLLFSATKSSKSFNETKSKLFTSSGFTSKLLSYFFANMM
jgi:hypothetical protein